MANKNTKQGQQTEQTLNKQEAFFLKYKKAIMIAVAAVIVLIAGIFLYQSQISKPREAKASTALALAQELFAAEQYEKALNGDSASFKGFLNVASEYSSTKAGNLANLYAGLCYAKLDKWAEAEKYLSKFSARDDQMISPAATAALGDAYAHNKQIDKAIDTFKKAAKMADSEAEDVNNSLAPTFLIKAAVLLESQNKKAEALKIYQDIKKKYVNSAVASEIDKYIERAQ